MLKHPRLKYCYYAEFLDEDKVLLLSEKDNTLLPGTLYREVLSYIRKDGVTVEDLISQLESKFSMLEVMTALNMLEKNGYLTESTSSFPHEVCAYWNSINIHPEALLNILEENPISIEFLGEFPQEVFLQAFQHLGIIISPTLKPSQEGNKSLDSPTLRVIVTNDYERKELQQINQAAITSKQPWMLVKPYGVELWIGPIFLPNQTGCWECLRQRLRNNRPMNTFFQHQKQTEDLPPLPAASLPATQQIVANLTALEISKWLYFGQSEGLEGKIMTFDTFTCTTQSHVLVKRPQCPACGEKQARRRKTPTPILLQKRSNTCVTTRGGYRDVLPEETIERYQHHVSPITGVVQSLKPYYPSEGAPIYNYFSGINVALRSKTLFWLNYHIRGTNGGKGTTRSQAKAGALCEAIERYSCTYQGEELYIIGSLKELGDDAIHPNVCMNFSAKQYQHREDTNKQCTKFYFLVPRLFDESLEMHWTPVYSLTNQTFKYLPSCFCYAQYPEEDEMNLFCYPDSNGNAAGNSIEEAILQGFLELVERDSVALWWYNMLRKPEVDVASFQYPYLTRVIDYYKTINRRIYVLDLTGDLNIPTFGAFSYHVDESNPAIIFGFGAHVDAKIALERAIVELNQILPIVNVAEADRIKGKYRIKDAYFLEWLHTATFDNQPYLLPQANGPKKTAADYAPLCEANIYDSLIFCIETAANNGLETLVLDMTRPDVGLPVAKVIVPGMRHFWKRLAPGRLYDVPVNMGWLQAPLKEEELNPIALFI
jgi:bacteriocin biosynthesis cyclodehydratase domain-containing protein